MDWINNSWVTLLSTSAKAALGNFISLFSLLREGFCCCCCRWLRANLQYNSKSSAAKKNCSLVCILKKKKKCLPAFSKCMLWGAHLWILKYSKDCPLRCSPIKQISFYSPPQSQPLRLMGKRMAMLSFPAAPWLEHHFPLAISPLQLFACLVSSLFLPGTK